MNPQIRNRIVRIAIGLLQTIFYSGQNKDYLKEQLTILNDDFQSLLRSLEHGD